MGKHRGPDRPEEGTELRESGTRRVAPTLKPVIVVADHSVVQTRELQELLEGAGYRAVTCSDGADVLRRVEEHRPDLVLLDLEVAGMSGVDVCHAIKKDKALALIPVIIRTACDHPKNLLSAFDAGCAGYLLKDASDDLLLDQVGRHVSIQEFFTRPAD